MHSVCKCNRGRKIFTRLLLLNELLRLQAPCSQWKPIKPTITCVKTPKMCQSSSPVQCSSLVVQSSECIHPNKHALGDQNLGCILDYKSIFRVVLLTISPERGSEFTTISIPCASIMPANKQTTETSMITEALQGPCRLAHLSERISEMSITILHHTWTRRSAVARGLQQLFKIHYHNQKYFCFHITARAQLL